MLKEATLAQTLSERHQHVDTIIERPGAKDPDYGHCDLLRRRRERPPRGGAAKTGDDLPSSHSITSSARARIAAGTSRPRERAVRRLITSSSLVARNTGNSPGLSPFRMRP